MVLYTRNATEVVAEFHTFQSASLCSYLCRRDHHYLVLVDVCLTVMKMYSNLCLVLPK
uniref:Uncharacterized protein n=1 Tax=Anguilla anguilla TaxID=7936 RepID=A0A0E9XK71_ANGAN